MKSKSNSTNEVTHSPIRILKIATCPSISGKSTLTWHLGIDSQGEIFTRVVRNSSSGFFSRHWISMSAIQQVLSKVPGDKPLTSFLLQPLYVGTSQNNYGFAWAILKAVGLVELCADKQRCYSLTDGKAFFAEVKTLRDKGVDLKVEEPKKRGAKTKKDTPVKITQAAKGAKTIVKPVTTEMQWPFEEPDAPPKVDAKSKQVAPKLKQKTAGTKAIAKTNLQSALGL